MIPIDVLAISGSLRAQSVNSALMRALARNSSSAIRVSVYTEVGDLPLFNPDLESIAPPPVHRLWAAVGGANALIIASPEYAHGVTAAIKNVLDWLVGYGPFYGMPTLVLNTSPRARHADEALRETLRTMSATLVDETSVVVPLLGSGLDEDGIVAAPWMSTVLEPALKRLHDLVVDRKTAL